MIGGAHETLSHSVTRICTRATRLLRSRLDLFSSPRLRPKKTRIAFCGNRDRKRGAGPLEGAKKIT